MDSKAFDKLSGKTALMDQQAYLELTYTTLRSLGSKLNYVEQLFDDKYPA